MQGPRFSGIIWYWGSKEQEAFPSFWASTSQAPFEQSSLTSQQLAALPRRSVMAQFSDTDSLVFALASFMCGLFLLERGADNFVDSTAILAKRLGISPTLVGLLTCGAEWEELVVIIVALSQGQHSMALGNLMGSSIANVLGSFSLGLLCAQKMMVFDRSSRIYSTALLGHVLLFLLVLYTVPAEAQQMAGIGLVVAFMGHMASVAWLVSRDILTAPEDDSDTDSDSDTGSNSDSDSDSGPTGNSDWDGDEHKEKNATRSEQELQGPSRGNGGWDEDGRALLFASGRSSDERQKTGVQPSKPLRKIVLNLLFGLGSLVLSGYVLAQSARIIGYQLGISGTVTGTTILSLATTLPEKLIAVLAGSRHQQGILVANTVGSNIFLVTLCAGVYFIWGGAGDVDEKSAEFGLSETVVMLVSTAALFLVVISGGRRWIGLVFLCGYVGFLCLEFVGTSDD